MADFIDTAAKAICFVALAYILGSILFGLGEYINQSANLKAAQAEHQRKLTRQTFGS